MRAPMRVTHISIIHRPLDNRIFEKECRAMARAGYDVHLVGAAPPADQIDGVRLHSIAADPARPAARRQLWRFLRAAQAAFQLRPSAYHLHDPHLIPLGLVLKLFGSRVVYDVHEDYPGHARSKLFEHPLRGRIKASLWKLLEWQAQRRFDGFVCASSTVAERFPPARSVVLHNFPRLQEFALAAGDPSVFPFRERRNRLIYTGYIHEIRGFWEIARALELLPADLDCRLRMIGHFRPLELERTARRLDAWSRMEFIPWQPHRQIVRELFTARVGIALLHRLPNHHDPIRSNKLFEYMAAGIPVIASDLPKWRELVCGLGCGLVVDPDDPEALAAAIEELITDPERAEEMGRRGRAAVKERFNWDREAPRLLALYDALEIGGVQLEEDLQEEFLEHKPAEREMATVSS
jgi:glycosyltransferase involved in cell wall biosynthesis